MLAGVTFTRARLAGYHPVMRALVAALAIATVVRAQSAIVLTQQEEASVGRLAAAEVEKEYPILNDPAVTEYITRLGERLVAKSRRADIPYTFRVVDGQDVNAFSLPGGYIYINRGLIESAASEAELAGALAHEIAHIVLRHGAEQAARANLAQKGMGVLGQILGHSTGAVASESAAQMVANGVFLRFSQNAERRADEVAARMVADTGYSPQAMVDFFNKLARVQQTQPDLVQRFFSSHPTPEERSRNIRTLFPELADGSATRVAGASPSAFAQIQQRLQTLPRVDLEKARAALVTEADAKPPADPGTDVRDRNLAQDREIAMKYAPVFRQALGPVPRYDFITNFDFDGDFRGDNNWINADNPEYLLKSWVYYAVFETRTHYFIQYSAFHPRDYKGGDRRGALLSEAIRLGVQLGGRYDPTGRADEAVLAHENDMEGSMVVVDRTTKKVVIVETLAHNAFLKYGPQAAAIAFEGSTHPVIYVEPMGHGQDAWRGDDAQTVSARNGFLIYRNKGKAEDPEGVRKEEIGYDLLPLLTSLWPRARSGKNDTFGQEHNYGILTLQIAGDGDAQSEQHIRLGMLGSAFNGTVGAPNMARPPWGWFDAAERTQPLGEWFLKPAETIRRRWSLPAASFSTTYLYHPFAGIFRSK